MINERFAREHLLPAGVMAFMLISFLALSFHFDQAWWRAHHGTAVAETTVGEFQAPRHLMPVPREALRMVERPTDTLLRVPGRVHWEVANSREWKGVEALMPEPRPISHVTIVEKNPKRPFRTLNKREAKQVIAEIQEAEVRSRDEALLVDPTYGRRFAAAFERNLTSYRQAIADAHELSAEQMSAIYRDMIEGPGARRSSPPHFANILP